MILVSEFKKNLIFYLQVWNLLFIKAENFRRALSLKTAFNLFCGYFWQLLSAQKLRQFHLKKLLLKTASCALKNQVVKAFLQKVLKFKHLFKLIPVTQKSHLPAISALQALNWPIPCQEKVGRTLVQLIFDRKTQKCG